MKLWIKAVALAAVTALAACGGGPTRRVVTDISIGSGQSVQGSFTGGAVPLVGVGGIATAEDAWARIRAGANLVQLYSAMVYEGPTIARVICKRLIELMKRDGFASIAEAVGSE